MNHVDKVKEKKGLGGMDCFWVSLMIALLSSGYSIPKAVQP
jgi:hypothetical protein